MLLITLGVALIFVQHERCASFDLCIDDGEPQILSFDCTTAQSFLFVSTSKRKTFQVERFMWNSLPRVQIIELFSPDILQMFTLMRAH